MIQYFTVRKQNKKQKEKTVTKLNKTSNKAL